MTAEIQRRRGTTAQHSTFTGAAGEITIDTDKNTVVVHDGTTVGGFPLVNENHSGNLTVGGNLTIKNIRETTDTSSSTTYELNPSTNGTRVTLTLSAETTLTDSLADGESISLRIKNGDIHDVIWVTGTLWVGGTEPVLTGDDRIGFEKWGSDLIGYVGLGIA